MSKRRLPNVMIKGPSNLASWTVRTNCPRTHHEEIDPRTVGKDPCSYVFVRNGYRAALCEHGQHPPDFCASCAPLWGVMAVKIAVVTS